MGKIADFFNNNFNVKKIMADKREYRQLMARLEILPKDYQYVFKKIQEHTYMFSGGNGMDIFRVHCDLIELFEEGAANGKNVLEITGEDVALFCEELLRNANAKTWTDDFRVKLNKDVNSKIGRLK